MTESERLERDVAASTALPPPHPRELRAQAVKRLQVGLLGLATMLLLVALANIIMEHARQDSASASGAVSSAGSAASAADPLADLGVIPSPDATSARKRAPAGGR
ncbi:MAG: hypothetical protein KGN34_15245 [Sphingomonadales bacterium]|nr:hypothetical protein [Sphingomonadales bacterium]